MPVGLYISIPFCRTKCSYCNFASDVFSQSAYQNYVGRLLEDIARARQMASELGCELDEKVDSIYCGGGTPSILHGSQILQVFGALRDSFEVIREAEITVECAPGTLSDSMIETLQRAGVNRVSLGVQSFVNQEAQSVGRLHKRATVLEEVARLRSAGIGNINIDLIAGLPHQTSESWTFSLAETIALGVPHASVYMLEVDEDSRLGRELIAGGTRYHAHFVPDDEATTDFYRLACDSLNSSGVVQYEISNFAREGRESRHNLKYWTRQPYLGFGVDAHSMLRACAEGSESIRLATSDSLDSYMNRTPGAASRVSRQAVIEESFFLGLRLNRGVDLDLLRAEFSAAEIDAYDATIGECLGDGLLEKLDATIRLTDRGRLLSNEVFAKFLNDEVEEVKVGTGHVNPR